MDLFLPPKYSLNSFFVRHVAHPRRMKYISGLNNAKICAVNDVGYIRNTPQTPQFPPNNFNEALIKSDSFNTLQKRERVVPPNGMWQTFGLIDDTENWRQQLNTLASSVGLLTQTDIEDYQRKKNRTQAMKNLQNNIQKSAPDSAAPNGRHKPCTPMNKPGSAAARYNEPLLTGRKASRHGSRHGSRYGSKAGSTGNLTGNKHFIVDQSEREAWMLQVLCQILQTDNLADVQAWLVSASDSDKERVKSLIDSAMGGLEQSGRIVERPETTQSKLPETPKTGTVVIPEEKAKLAASSSIAQIESVLQKFDMSKSNGLSSKPPRTASKEQTKLPNILRLDDNDSEDVNNGNNTGGAKTQRPVIGNPPVPTTTININMTAPLDTRADPVQAKKMARFAEEAIVKLEAISPRADYSIENVNLTMTLKDDKTGSMNEMSGKWEHQPE